MLLQAGSGGSIHEILGYFTVFIGNSWSLNLFVQRSNSYLCCLLICSILNINRKYSIKYLLVAGLLFVLNAKWYLILEKLLQPLMLIVPDVQDVYTPLETDVIVPLSEVGYWSSHYVTIPINVTVDLNLAFPHWSQCRQHVELLLESIPTMFETNKTADSALGAAMKVGVIHLMMFTWCSKKFWLV